MVCLVVGFFSLIFFKMQLWSCHLYMRWAIEGLSHFKFHEKMYQEKQNLGQVLISQKQCYKTVRFEHLTADAKLTLVKSRNKIHCMSCWYMRGLIQPTAAEVLGCPESPGRICFESNTCQTKMCNFTKTGTSEASSVHGFETRKSW